MPTGIYERKPRITRMADCHPDRKHFGKGLCDPCYHKAYHVQHKMKSVFGIKLPSGFYTYLWLREDGTPYYVGKGSRERAYVNFGHSVHTPTNLSRILVQEHASEADSLFAEIFLIAVYGRIDNGTGILRNLTDGGENPPGNKGVTFSEEHKRKIGEAQKGPKGHWYGTKRPYKSRNTRGRKQTPEHIASKVASRLRNAELKKRGAPSDAR